MGKKTFERWRCEICGTTIGKTWERLAQVHVLSHYKELTKRGLIPKEWETSLNKSVCPICGRKFNQITKLLIHLAFHKEALPILERLTGTVIHPLVKPEAPEGAPPPRAPKNHEKQETTETSEQKQTVADVAVSPASEPVKEGPEVSESLKAQEAKHEEVEKMVHDDFIEKTTLMPEGEKEEGKPPAIEQVQPQVETSVESKPKIIPEVTASESAKEIPVEEILEYPSQEIREGSLINVIADYSIPFHRKRPRKPLQYRPKLKKSEKEEQKKSLEGQAPKGEEPKEKKGIERRWIYVAALGVLGLVAYTFLRRKKGFEASVPVVPPTPPSPQPTALSLPQNPPSPPPPPRQPDEGLRIIR